MIQGLAAGEFAGAQSPQQLVDVAAALVDVPRDNREPIDRLARRMRRTWLKEDRANRLAPAREPELAGRVGRRAPRRQRIRRRLQLTAGKLGNP
jgi:hypothetical protein